MLMRWVNLARRDGLQVKYFFVDDNGAGECAVLSHTRSRDADRGDRKGIPRGLQAGKIQ